jgi:hypothetical protein
MKDITISGYAAKELNDKARLKVLSDYSEINVTDDWYQELVEEFKTRMEGYGIQCEVYFSGFYSQGDGACLVSDTINTEAVVRRLFEEGHSIPEDCLHYSGDLTLRVEKVHATWARRYDHEQTVAAVVYNDSETIIADHDINALESVVTEWVQKQCNTLYQDLETEYENLTKDQAILDRLEEDECYFTANGTIIPA